MREFTNVRMCEFFNAKTLKEFAHPHIGKFAHYFNLFNAAFASTKFLSSAIALS